MENMRDRARFKEQPMRTRPIFSVFLTGLAALVFSSVAVAQIRVSGGGSSVGYIDPAEPMNQLRLRFDANYNNVRPRRAEFFWAKTPPPVGPVRAETSVDYQDVQALIELKLCDQFSIFVEGPYRFLNPERNDNEDGIGDMTAGFKYAILDCCDCLATFQFKAYFPTGDGSLGLGTDHYSVEPGLLFLAPLCEGWTVEGEVRYWIPIDGTDFAGDVVRYGVGVSWLAHESCTCRVSPVAEFVGWTVLDGKASGVAPNGQVFVEDSKGDTIVNAKVGVRIASGSHELYAGYGRALTGDTWYDNVWRVEWRLRF
jgi:hypothetical protein